MSEPALNLDLELERVARVDPHRPALSDPEEALTYGELLARARALAASLPPARGEDPQPVALLMPHRAGTVVGMVAAMLAGRPYCVLNPAQPRQRIESLMAAIEADVIWASDATLRDRLEAIGLQAAAPIARPDRDLQPVPARPSHPIALYVTSGSSGDPKLVAYRGQATRHRAELYAAAIAAGSGDRFSLVSPLWTAAAASALFAALLRGASLELLEPAGLAPAALADRVAASGITVWHSTPSLFRRLAGAGMLAGNRFRVLRLGGEPVLATDVELARRVCASDTVLVTGYSLTEANGVVTQKAVPLEGAKGAAVADSGPPIPGVELRVEDQEGNALPAGSVGEIVVGGGHLSAGYAGFGYSPTGTRFTRRGRALFLHTGDRGSLRADGSLEVRGRDDARLKIRGHRVDPIEIQAAALRHGGVLDAAIIPFAARGETAIAIFAVADDRAGPLTPASLRAHLEQLLAPEAMPAVVHVLDELPLTASGKVDRPRLARVAGDRDRGRRARRERADPLVGHLLALWREALEVDELGPDEDFFALGGDSLAAVEVCAGIESVYGIPLEPATLLRHRTARAFAAHVRDILQGPQEASAKILQLNPAGDEPPLFVIPGAGSEATALVHFAEAIGAPQPVYVIQLPGVDGRSRPLTRMNQIVAHCEAAIRESGVHPPYRIAGTSFGALVAYGVASELLDEGLETGYLGLFDAPAPIRSRNGYLTAPLRRFRVPPGLSARGLRRNPRRELKRLRAPLRNLLINYRLALSLRLGLGWQPPIRLRFRYLRTACSIAANGWTPPRGAMPLHLYRCESQPAHLAGAAFLGWDRFAPDIAVRGLPSSHGRHIRPPAVGHLAAMVREDLSRSRARQPSRVA